MSNLGKRYVRDLQKVCQRCVMGIVTGVSLITGEESLVTGVSLSLGAKLPSQGQSNPKHIDYNRYTQCL